MTKRKKPLDAKLHVDLSPAPKAENKKTLYARIKATNFEFLVKLAKDSDLSIAILMDRIIDGIRQGK